MKLNEPCWAVVDAEGNAVECKSEQDAEVEIGHRAEAGWDVENDRIVSVVVIESLKLDAMRSVLRESGHILDAIAIGTHSVPQFQDILGRIAAMLESKGGN